MFARPTAVRRLTTLTAAVFVVAVVAGISAAATSANPVNGSDANGTYLALGDSVAFGYVPPNAVPAPDYLDAHSFVGYPEFLASSSTNVSRTRLVRARRRRACSSPGYRATAARTRPARLSAIGRCSRCTPSTGERRWNTRFTISAAHKHTRLVTIDIGANDTFLCQETTADNCASELPGVAAEIAVNLGTIFHELRDDAGYTGPIVALEYYSLSYSDPTTVAGTQFLNSVIANVTTANGGIVADGFSAFEGPSVAFGGDPCAAGLLIKLPDGTCNIHPSPTGQQLLAGAIAEAIGA